MKKYVSVIIENVQHKLENMVLNGVATILCVY